MFHFLPSAAFDWARFYVLKNSTAQTNGNKAESFRDMFNYPWFLFWVKLQRKCLVVASFAWRVTLLTAFVLLSLFARLTLTSNTTHDFFKITLDMHMPLSLTSFIFFHLHGDYRCCPKYVAQHMPTSKTNHIFLSC